MRIVFATVTAATIAILAATCADAADRVYRCEDGTFTNRAEKMCAAYEPAGVIMVLPKGESMRSARPGAPKLATVPRPTQICELFDEWVALDLRTEQGKRFDTADERARWTALSRLIATIGTPRCG